MFESRYFPEMVFNILRKKKKKSSKTSRALKFTAEDKPRLQARVERLKENTTWLHLCYLMV